jgi:hypothetical protein
MVIGWQGFAAERGRPQPSRQTLSRHNQATETHPAIFVPLLGRVLPLQIDQKTEQKTVVRYETVEERRAAMLAKGWAPSALAALEEAMEPKFLRDMRAENMREQNEGQGEAARSGQVG